MDADVMRLLAYVDQTDAELRKQIGEADNDTIAQLIKTCSKGNLSDLDEKEQLLVGLLATTKIFNYIELNAQES